MKAISRVNIAHTINSVALSAIGIYTAAFLLTLGYPLAKVVLFYVLTHIVGLFFGLFIITPLIHKWGPIRTFRFYYPLKIISLLLLIFLQYQPIPLVLIAFFEGASNSAYHLPFNILLITGSNSRNMGENLSRYLGIPRLLSIIGPLAAALLIPWIGFWPFFAAAVVGMVLSYLPLIGVDDKEVQVNLDFAGAWQRLKNQKLIFLLEGLDNIVEESEWFWGIFVFLMIGSLATPGIIGTSQQIGFAIFTLIVGKHVNRFAKKIIPLAAIAMMLIYVLRIFISSPLAAYVVTAAASFFMILFLVSYFTTIFKTVKGEGEVEFIILREIPTVLGRMVVFGTVWLVTSNLRLFFLMPLVFVGLLLSLYYWKRKSLVG